MVIDLPSDKGLAHFNAISKVLTLPEFVKEADFSEQCEVEKLPAYAFADSVNRKFPVHTKAATYLSYAYFRKQADQLSQADRVRCVHGFLKAAEYWDMQGDLAAIEIELNKKAAAPELKYALEVNGNKYLPINSPEQIMKCAEELITHQAAGTLDYTLRSTAAKNIMKAAVACGLPDTAIPHKVHQMAGLGLTTKEAVLHELSHRWSTERKPSLSAPLAQCIASLQKSASEILNGDTCDTFAKIIEAYDGGAKGKQSTPETVLFAFTKHSAQKIAKQLATMPDGTTYRMEDLVKAADAFNVLGESTVEDLYTTFGHLSYTKVAELLDTLPRTDSDSLKEALNLAGVRPVTLDKVAMVKAAVAIEQEARPLEKLAAPAEPRESILAKVEANDPLVKRAMDVIRKLKTAGEKKEEPKADFPPAPRGIRGLFVNKAENKEEKSEAGSRCK